MRFIRLFDIKFNLLERCGGAWSRGGRGGERRWGKAETSIVANGSKDSAKQWTQIWHMGLVKWDDKDNIQFWLRVE